MSAPDRRAMLDHADKALSVPRQCALLSVARSVVYRAPGPPTTTTRLMRRMGIAALGPKPRTTKPAPGHTGQTGLSRPRAQTRHLNYLSNYIDKYVILFERLSVRRPRVPQSA
jgi:hypothetical protein